MRAEQWQKIESLYHSARARKPGEWRAFLESACGSDEALRREVESLLDSDDLAASFLETDQPEAPRQAAEPLVPTSERIGPYLIVEFLRAGGMGEVYKARDTRLDRTVAIKFLPRAFAADPAALERFQREARAASALNHPRICTIYDLGEHQGRPFFVMEFLEGQSLRDRIAGKPVPLAEFLDLGVQIADALQAAHAKGIVHRDIKPGNIFVTPNGLIKVLDFGLAKLGPEPRSAATAVSAATIDSTVTGITLTRPGSTMGTLTYLSPEQARGEEVDARTDIFSFGVVLYEMATGRPAFRGETSAELLDAILRERPPKPSNLNSAVPGGVERIILKMLEKDRTARPQAAGEVLAELEEFQQAAAAAPRTRRWLLGSSAAALVTLAGGAFLTRLSIFAPRRKIKVAVLPLESLDGDPKQAWFAEGLHEEMISILGRLYPDGLGIIARTSVKRYQGTNRRIDQIGRDLKVDYVVEGGVRREGGSIRITARLIRVKDQTQLWSATYDRDLRQVLPLQGEVAQAVAQGIERSLRPSPQVQLALARPLNPQAHEAYLRRDYAKAAQIDPNYAPAWAGLAGSTCVAAVFGFIPPLQGFAKAKEAATKAVELDPTLADAHSTLAFARLHGEWKWREAEEGIRHALQLNPSNAWARHMFAHFLLWDNRARESAEECNRAFEYSPFDPDMVVCTAWHEAWAGDYDKAIASIRRAFSWDAENKGAMLVMGWAYEQKGMFQEAVSALEKSPAGTGRTASMAHALALWGKRQVAERLLAQLLEDSKKKYVSAYDIAVVYSGLGNRERAFEWLNKAYNEHAGMMPYVRSDPRLKPLRGDRRFQDILRRMGSRNLTA
jgi:TolB-like protein